MIVNIIDITDSKFNLFEQKIIQKNEVLLLPENFFGNDVYESQGRYVNGFDTLGLKKFIRISFQKELSVLSSTDLGIEANVLSRHSDNSKEKWLGTIAFDKIILPIMLGVLTNYLSQNLEGLLDKNDTVNVELYIKDEQRVKQLKYSGDSKTLLETLEKLSLEGE